MYENIIVIRWGQYDLYHFLIILISYKKRSIFTIRHFGRNSAEVLGAPRAVAVVSRQMASPLDLCPCVGALELISEVMAVEV